MTRGRIRIGTRSSALALWQARWTQSAIESRYPELQVDLIPIRTTGDRIQDVPLAGIGGKGLFTRELDEALLRADVDLAVHSMKDVPYSIPDPLHVAAVPVREDPRDAAVCPSGNLSALPPGSRIGTGSLRRQCQLRAHYPHLEYVDVRGNVDTRLRKLDAGDFASVILAAAGLRRLGHADRIAMCFEPRDVLPAVGQGALALVCRRDDLWLTDLLNALNDPATRRAVDAERGLLTTLQASCHVPVAGHARIEDGRLRLRGWVSAPDGSHPIVSEIDGVDGDGAALGTQLGQQMLDLGAADLLGIGNV